VDAKQEPINKEAVASHINGARDALQSAQYGLDGDFYDVAINRAYYVFFYAATALLLSLDLTRNKHSGVLAAFRELLVKPGIFSTQDSHAYGRAFELRNTTDYETLGKVDPAQANATLQDARRSIEKCETYLNTKGYL